MKKTVLSIVIILSGIALVSYYYGFRIYTYYWHAKHPGPIDWYDFRIKIPKALIARIIEDSEGNNELQVYYLAHPEKAHILFEKVTYHLKEDFDFYEKFKIAGYRILEKESHSIQGYPCIWIKSLNQGGEKIYQEDIFFKSKDIRVTFIGDIEKRHYLVEIVGALDIVEGTAFGSENLIQINFVHYSG